jgi:hypothetical protein
MIQDPEPATLPLQPAFDGLNRDRLFLRVLLRQAVNGLKSGTILG